MVTSEQKSITTCASISWDQSEGIMHVRFLPDIEISLKHAKENLQQFQFFTPQKVKLLSDITEILSISKEAREFYSSREFSEKITANAVIVGALHTKLIFNFFQNFNKPKFPIRAFNSERDAKLWLAEF